MTIVASMFSDPFKYIAAKAHEFKQLRETTKEALSGYGWILRPNHEVSGRWRARRYSKKGGTEHLSADSSEALIALAKADYDKRNPGRPGMEARSP